MSQNNGCNGEEKVRVQVIEIDGLEASKILKESEGYNYRKPHTNAQIQAWARDILANKWDLNGETLKFDAKGRLRDGQNRLMALVEAAKSRTDAKAQFIAVYNVKRFDNVDRGKSRSFVQDLACDGFANATEIAAAVRILWRKDYREEHDLPGKNDFFYNNSDHKPTDAQLRRTLKNHEGIVDSIGFVGAPCKRGGIGLRSQMAVFNYLTRKIDPEAADQFIIDLADLDAVPSDMPVYVLNKRLEKITAKDYSAPDVIRHKMALVVLAWNHTMRDERIVQLSWKPSGTRENNFPIIQGRQQELYSGWDDDEVRPVNRIRKIRRRRPMAS